MTTINTITDEQIIQLREEAEEAWDTEQVLLCLRALVLGDDEARAECARIISDAEAQRGE